MAIELRSGFPFAVWLEPGVAGLEYTFEGVTNRLDIENATGSLNPLHVFFTQEAFDLVGSDEYLIVNPGELRTFPAEVRQLWLRSASTAFLTVVAYLRR